MKYYVMFDNEEIQPISFSASSEEDAWNKLEKAYPRECVDNFEDIAFLAGGEDLDDELWEYHLALGIDTDEGDTPKFTKKSFLKVEI